MGPRPRPPSDLSKRLGPVGHHLRQHQILRSGGPLSEPPRPASHDVWGNGGVPWGRPRLGPNGKTSRELGGAADGSGGHDLEHEGLSGPPPWDLAPAFRHRTIPGSDDDRAGRKYSSEGLGALSLGGGAGGRRRASVLSGQVLAARRSGRPMDGHEWDWRRWKGGGATPLPGGDTP